MKILAFDTETSGLPQAGKPFNFQPHVIQLAASLFDESRRPIFELSTLIKLPQGATIHPKAQEVHGITAEMCNDLGMEKFQALRVLEWAARKAGRYIAHNAEFDMTLLSFEALRCNIDHPLDSNRVYCTCEAATPVLRLPPTERMKHAGFTGFKKANLGECYRFFFNEELEGAHDALIDTRGCARVYYALEDRAKTAE